MSTRTNNLLTGIISFTVLTGIWVYLFTFLNIGFSDSFNFVAWGKAISLNFIFVLIMMGFVFAAALYVLIYYSAKLKNIDLVVISSVGSIITLIAGIVLRWFSSLSIFAFFMFFYALSCIYLSYRDYIFKKSSWSRAKFGWGASKRVFLVLGVSGLLGGLLFTYLSLPTYQGLVKSSLLNFTSNVDIGSIMSREDVRQIVMEQELSRDQIKNLVTQQYQQQSWFNALSASQQEQLIENATTETYNAQINNREQNVDNMYNFLKDRRLSLPSVTGDLIERIPLTKAMLDLMPIFTGLLLMSAITVFGQFFVGPFLALFSLGLKEKIPTNP